MNRIDLVIRWTLAGLAGAIVAYCVLVMVVVATAPDLRMRFQLLGSANGSPGVLIADTVDLKLAESYPDNIKPEPGDILLELDGKPITTSVDFMRAQFNIRNPTGESEPAEFGAPRPNAPDSALVTFRQKDPEPAMESFVLKRRVRIQSVPSSEISLTLVWFLLELIIFSVSAVAFWNRPFDDAARLFFAMCTVTLGAFVGGFHWWTLGSNFWLNIPFAICGILLPAVILHFFLVYPRPKPPLTLWPASVISAIYAVPLLAIMGFLFVDGLLWTTMSLTPGTTAYVAAVEIKPILLEWLRFGIYTYIGIAAVYFVAAQVALTHSWLTTRNPIERNQVGWILRAGCVASVFIGYALYLAFFRREYFAIGGGRVPMFLASLVFMLAYAVGIVRFKLMLIDQIVNRGIYYYVLSYGATGAVAFCIASGTLALASHNNYVAYVGSQPTRIIAGILMLAVIMLIWLRDSWQKFIDRRFFREKYRLDKTLQRMNQAVGRLADVDFLSERMLSSCRDVLQSELVAIYLREGKSNNFRLVGAEGDSTGIPMQVAVPDELYEALLADPTLQRVTSESRDSITPIQGLLRQVKADLVHGLETNGEITGIVVLGSKLNGVMYSAEDLTFLTALGQIAGIALHCARVHQNLKHVNEELRSKVDQIAQQRQQIAILQSELTTTRIEPPTSSVVEFRRDSIIGNSDAISRILDLVRKVAPSESSVLVRGESGTGKELLAKAIHDNSARRNGPLVSVHCAALSSGLLESELFGHVKGAFTGAHSDKQGRFELANEGTLFLDEIGDISLETQVKLLRVLQQREFEPVGGTQTIHVDVRLIAATHQNLERLIAEGKFREDLFYRLNVISVPLPPLRERQEDILDLAVFFLKSASARAGKRIAQFDDDALNALIQYSWPGNIRELQNVIERAVVLAERETIELADLPHDIQNFASTARVLGQNMTEQDVMELQPVSTIEWLEDDPSAERKQLLDALRHCNGNKTKAARRLGLPRSTYFSKLKKYGIMGDESNEPPRYGRLPR